MFNEETSTFNRNIDIQISADNLTAYIKLEKPNEENGELPAAKEEILSALARHGVVYGIRDAVIDKLSETPVYAFRMEVAKGQAPVAGIDGHIVTHVVKDKDYKPEYSEEGIIDYKNVDYFQLAKKGQILCDIIAPGSGTDGVDVFGMAITARKGREPAVPQGENTSLTEDNAHLVADIDGLVRYLGSRIDISEMLQIRSDANNLTGNVNFSGDVTVFGDVRDGISVKAGGNVIVKGVIEDASVEAGGSLHVMNGIISDGKSRIASGKGLTCKYIENAVVDVTGDIHADYIIDSDVKCTGDIILNGAKELLLGGSVTLSGELRVRDIGNPNEKATRIDFVGRLAIDEQRIMGLQKELDATAANVNSLLDRATWLAKKIESGAFELGTREQLVSLKQEITYLSEKADDLSSEIDMLKKREFTIYPGFITCKRKIYQGVRIYFGEQRYQFNLDNIEHCRIHWVEGNIVQSTL